MEVGFAEHDRTATAQCGDVGIVVWRDVVRARRQAVRRRQTADILRIFDRDRHAVERADALAAHTAFVGESRFGERDVVTADDDRAQRPIDRLDAGDVRGDDLDARRFARGDRGGELRRGSFP